MFNSLDTVIRKVDDFFSSYPTLSFKRGSTIFQAGDSPSNVYFLKSGYVNQYIISPSGETCMVHIYKPGSFFPLMCTINETPNIFTFDAMIAVRVVRVPKDVFVDFLHNNSDVLFYTTQRILVGLSGLVNRVGQLVLDDAYTKTVLLLLYYADNFGEKSPEGIGIQFPLAHREIASWIGTTRETASIQIETLKKKGLILVHGRQLIIRDEVALQKTIHR